MNLTDAAITLLNKDTKAKIVEILDETMNLVLMNNFKPIGTEVVLAMSENDEDSS